MASLDNPVIEQFKRFGGGFFESPLQKKMPLLLSGKNEKGKLIDVPRVPMSFYGFMNRYLEVLSLLGHASKYLRPACDALLRSLDTNYFFTGDGAVRHSNGRLKVVPDAQYLRLLTPETKLVKSAVDLSYGGYENLAGEEFSQADVEFNCCKWQSRSQAKRNPVWLALARGDKALLNEFVDARFAREKQLFGWEGSMMGVYAPRVPKKEAAAGRLWAVNRLHDFYIGSSHANGKYSLNNGGGWWLIGVAPAPEAQRAAAHAMPTLEQKIEN